MSASYYAPENLDEAMAVMQAHGPAIIAGGTDYFPARGRAPQTGSLLDVTRLRELRGFTQTDAGLRIGAATTWTDIVNADLPPAFDALRAAGREVGSIQIQNTGTIAGNLCNASPAADGIPPLLILDAEVELAGANGRRMLSLSDFVLGPRQTALRPGEIVVAVHVPTPPAQSVSAFEKLGARKYLVISIAMTAVLIVLDGESRIALARIAVGSCAPVARRLPALEQGLIGQSPQDVQIDPQWLLPLSPITDVRADDVYRSEAVPHQIARAIGKAVSHG